MSGWKEAHAASDYAQGQSDKENGTYNPPSNLSFSGTAMADRNSDYDAGYNGESNEDTSDDDSD